MSVFEDQKKFMLAGDQSIGVFNESQFRLYVSLIDEEVGELKDAIMDNDIVETVDAVLDTIVVCLGALHSLGVDPEGAWAEVIRSNMSKVDPITGKMLKREDGKIIKHPDWSAPNLQPFISRAEKPRIFRTW
jgi:predicted HAD superfamily Cof-like phosphohydrolase